MEEEMKRVPFYSQIVNWNQEDSGFPNAAEIEKWQSNCCGIACVRMIIDAFTGVNVSYWDLLQQGLARKAYNEIGWIHQGLVQLAAEHGVTGKAHRGKTWEDVEESLRNGNLCIVSVSVGFRGGLKKANSEEVFGKGGHLVAFEDQDGAPACHHPSSLPEWNKEGWVVPAEAWTRSFSGGYMEFSGASR